jgi:hypothetical protein
MPDAISRATDATLESLPGGKMLWHAPGITTDTSPMNGN